LLFVLLGAAAVLTAAPAAAAPRGYEGLWRAQSGGGEIRLYACGEFLCGRLITSDRIRREPGLKDRRNPDPALRSRPLAGIVMLRGLRPSGDDWSGGTLYDPQNGNTYSGVISLQGSGRLMLKGCVLGVLCREQIWTRIAD
jgi:uncharacterized protein (DUF2147 family)